MNQSLQMKRLKLWRSHYSNLTLLSNLFRIHPNSVEFQESQKILFRIRSSMDERIDSILREMLETWDPIIQQVVALMVTQYFTSNWSKINKGTYLEVYENLMKLILIETEDKTTIQTKIVLMRLAWKIAKLLWLNSTIFKVRQLLN